MACAWDEYIKEFGKAPENPSQLMTYSGKNTKCKKLTFKDAKVLFDEKQGKPNNSNNKSNTKPPTSNNTKPNNNVSKPVPPPVNKIKNEPESKQEHEHEHDHEQQQEEQEHGLGGLFNQLNQGLDVTRGLKKVTDDMKTKNRTDKSGKVPDSQKEINEVVKTEKAAPTKKNASVSQQGPRWIAEYVTEGVQELDKADVKNDVLITSCENCAFLIPKKVKAVSIDGCKKVQVEIHEVVSTIDVVNCDSVTIFVRTNAPSINIDKCSAPKLVIFKDALDRQPNIITSLTSDMNIEVPGHHEEDDFIAIPVPSQFITIIDPVTKKSTTKPTENFF